MPFAQPPMRFAVRLIAAAVVLPALAACSGERAPEPLSKEALAAVSKSPGAPTAELARAVDEAFTKDGVGETRAVLVMHGGTIAAERYAPGYGPKTRFVSWSMAKTVTGVMIGMLVADGRLRLDETPPVPRWQRPGDPRGEITLRQLLQMRSGLRHCEACRPPYESSEVRMLFLDGRDNMAEFAESQPLEAEPGKHWEYSSNTTVILADIAARVLTGGSTDPEIRRRAVADYLESRLFGPLGMTSMVPEFDRSGTLIGGSLIHGTARDWARFGDFLRNKGSYRGTQLVPRRWIEFMTTSNPRRANYGAQTWLNRGAPKDDDPLFSARGPKSLFAMIGHMGQFVLVAPDRKLVVVRLGHSDSEQIPREVQELADIVELYPPSGT